MALKIRGRGFFQLVLSDLVVGVQFIFHDPGVDWIFCYGFSGVVNQWSCLFSVGYFFLSELVVGVQCIRHDPGFDCCIKMVSIEKFLVKVKEYKNSDA